MSAVRIIERNVVRVNAHATGPFRFTWRAHQKAKKKRVKDLIRRELETMGFDPSAVARELGL